MEDNDIKLIQCHILDILRELLRIFKKYNLNYYILGGTLLGAVRHNGFIPWDDDLDIGLPRPDYEAFSEIISKELNPPFAVHSLKSGLCEFSYYYIRIVDSRLQLIRRNAEKDVQLPVWIDVFPLDGTPNNRTGLKQWVKKGNFLLKLFNLSQFEYYYYFNNKKKKYGFIKTPAKKLLWKIGLFEKMDTMRCWKRLDKHLKKYNYEQSNNLINFCGYWKIKEFFPKSVYGKGRLYQFEDLMLNGPEDYDFVLKQMYGDYMTPPPENQRDHHYVEIIKNDNKNVGNLLDGE